MIKAAVLSVLVSVGAPAFAQAQQQFNIPGQDLASSLNQLAVSADRQIVFAPQLVKGLKAPALAGAYTLEEALRKLLEPAGLKAEYLDDKTVAVRSVSESDSRESHTTSAGEENSYLRLAQNSFSSQTDASTAESSSSEGMGGRGGESESRTTLEEVIVTAQKREERLQDVPIAISVLDGDELDGSTVDGATDALRRVPGVSALVTAQGGGTQLSIRGVSAGNALLIGSSTVGYYLDAAPFAFSRSAVVPDANVYDLDRIEVLRGPQGTLYGASALNGVVRVLTHDADLNDFEFKGRTSASSTEHGQESYRGDVAINVPLVEDVLAVRAVLGYQDLGGWIDRVSGEDANDGEITTGRFRINAQPTEHLSIGLSAWLSESDFAYPSTSDRFDSLTSPLVAEEPMSTDFDIFGLTVGYDFPHFSVESSTSHIDYTNHGFIDGGFNDANGDRVRLETTLEAEVLTQEVNITSLHAGPWRWSLGAMYREADDRTLQYYGPLTAVVPSDNYDRSRSTAVYGELTRAFLNDRFEITVGLRSFEDQLTQGENTDFSRNSSPGNGLYYVRNTYDSTSPRVALTWHATENLTTYATYSEGFRSGRAQSETVRLTAPNIPAVEPDTLHNYEVGLKGSVWNGRLQYEAAAYFMDWTGIQQALGIPYQGTTIAATINGASASGPGIEFSTTAKITDGLTVGANFSWNDLTFDSDVVTVTGTPPNAVPVLLYASGERTTYSPEYTAGISADYVFPLWSAGLEGHLSSSANYVSEQYVRGNSGTVVTQADTDALLFSRASFGMESERWTATLFAENLGDEQNAALRITPTGNNVVRPRPRTIGVQFTFRH